MHSASQTHWQKHIRNEGKCRSKCNSKQRGTHKSKKKSTSTLKLEKPLCFLNARFSNFFFAGVISLYGCYLRLMGATPYFISSPGPHPPHPSQKSDFGPNQSDPPLPPLVSNMLEFFDFAKKKKKPNFCLWGLWGDRGWERRKCIFFLKKN